MANANSPFGLKPVRHLNGSPYNGAGQLVYVPSSDGTALFIGDPVKLAGSSDATYGVPTVTQAGPLDIIYGVVLGVDPVLGGITPNLNIAYRPALTAQYLYVCNDPTVIYAIQSSGTVAAADIGKNASCVVGAGSTVTNLSGFKLDETTVNITNTLQFHIIDVYPLVGQTIGAYSVVEVTLNTGALMPSTAGV